MAWIRVISEREATGRLKEWYDKLTDWRRADLTDADRAMLTYAEKLTIEPWAMVEADVQALRVAGFDDTGILDINQVTGYYAYVNRLADGLGVGLEEVWGSAE